MQNYICSEGVLQRCSARKMLCKHGTNPQGSNNTEWQPQQSCFATLNISGGLLLHVKRVLKDLNYKKFLFTVVKINLLTLKMNKETNK